MRLIALLPLVVCACTSLAQATELTVETRSVKGTNSRGEAYVNGKVKMPLVKPRQASDPMAVQVARKINDRLSFVELEGTESQEFKVSRNDGRIMTIAFDGESCGAYCESYNSWYSFDLQDGSMLTPANLFTANGMHALAVRLQREQHSRYRKQLAELASDLKATRAATASKTGESKLDIISDLEDRIALNQVCLDDQIARAKEPASQQGHGLFGYPGTFPFEITDTAFKLTAGRCSNHAARAIDDVGDVTLALPIPELAPWLTAYGRAALLKDGSAVPQERVFGQVLYGALRASNASTVAITMLIEKSDDSSLSGAYFYDRYRAPIELTGQLTAQTLDLQESGAAKPGQPTADATFQLTKAGNALRGQWANKADKKTFEVRLAP
jgi:hypothetical protein